MTEQRLLEHISQQKDSNEMLNHIFTEAEKRAGEYDGEDFVAKFAAYCGDVDQSKNMCTDFFPQYPEGCYKSIDELSESIPEEERPEWLKEFFIDDLLVQQFEKGIFPDPDKIVPEKQKLIAGTVFYYAVLDFWSAVK